MSALDRAAGPPGTSANARWPEQTPVLEGVRRAVRQPEPEPGVLQVRWMGFNVRCVSGRWGASRGRWRAVCFAPSACTGGYIWLRELPS